MGTENEGWDSDGDFDCDIDPDMGWGTDRDSDSGRDWDPFTANESPGASENLVPWELGAKRHLGS